MLFAKVSSVSISEFKIDTPASNLSRKVSWMGVYYISIIVVLFEKHKPFQLSFAKNTTPISYKMRNFRRFSYHRCVRESISCFWDNK